MRPQSVFFVHHSVRLGVILETDVSPNAGQLHLFQAKFITVQLSV